MSEPWNFTEAQRRQFREAHAEAKQSRPPAKRWRITTASGTFSYTSERKLYEVLNDQVNRVASIGAKVDIHHLEGGRWVLYERAVITENGWEPA